MFFEKIVKILKRIYFEKCFCYRDYPFQYFFKILNFNCNLHHLNTVIKSFKFTKFNTEQSQIE